MSLAEIAGELMVRLIADPPLSERLQVIPNPRLCEALIDRLTDQAHILNCGRGFLSFRSDQAQPKARKS